MKYICTNGHLSRLRTVYLLGLSQPMHTDDGLRGAFFLRPWWLACLPWNACIPRASSTQTLTVIQHWKYGVAAACLYWCCAGCRQVKDKCSMKEIRRGLILIWGLRFKCLLFTPFGLLWDKRLPSDLPCGHSCSLEDMHPWPHISHISCYILMFSHDTYPIPFLSVLPPLRNHFMIC